MLLEKGKLLKKISLIMLILILPTLTSCQSCPEKNESEIIHYLDAGSFPELIDITIFDSEEKKIMLSFFTDAYSEHLKLLLSCRSTGLFTDSVDEEIQYCEDVLNWLDSLSEEKALLD